MIGALHVVQWERLFRVVLFKRSDDWWTLAGGLVRLSRKQRARCVIRPLRNREAIRTDQEARTLYSSWAAGVLVEGRNTNPVGMEN